MSQEQNVEVIAKDWQKLWGFSKEVSRHIAAEDYKEAFCTMGEECSFTEQEWISILIQAHEMVRKNRLSKASETQA